MLLASYCTRYLDGEMDKEGDMPRTKVEIAGKKKKYPRQAVDAQMPFRERRITSWERRPSEKPPGASQVKNDRCTCNENKKSRKNSPSNQQPTTPLVSTHVRGVDDEGVVRDGEHSWNGVNGEDEVR